MPMLQSDLIKYLEGAKGSFLVVGPPGTGKTYQLIRLISYLVTSKKIKPERIIVFCFNRRWAKNLRESTAGLVVV